MHPVLPSRRVACIRCIPEMLQLTTDNASRPWNALGLPHSVGSGPVKLLRPTSRTVRDGRELLPAQEAGRTPLRSVSTSRSDESDAKAPEFPHCTGSVPAQTLNRLLSLRKHGGFSGRYPWKGRTGHLTNRSWAFLKGKACSGECQHCTV